MGYENKLKGLFVDIELLRAVIAVKMKMMDRFNEVVTNHLVNYMY